MAASSRGQSLLFIEGVLLERRPLSTLLSQVLIAFTIEFDNEAERQIRAAGSMRQFLVSLPFWGNVMRFVSVDGITVRALQVRAGIGESPSRSGLHGLERWRYVTVEPDEADPRAKPPQRDWLVRPTPAGRRAQRIWRPLTEAIEARWRERFGSDLDPVRGLLAELLARLDLALPAYLPVLGYGMTTSIVPLPRDVPVPDDLASLLSRVLLAFTLDYEREATLSLAIGANVVRLIEPKGVPVRDLPKRAGVSKEAVAMSVGFLARHGYADIAADPGAPRTKRVLFTAKGRRARDADRAVLASVEERWHARYGRAKIEALREGLQHVIDANVGGSSNLGTALRPALGGWRLEKAYVAQTNAFVRDPAGALPHYPMVLHRGGWPDGS